VTEAIHDEDVNVTVGQKVMLPCNKLTNTSVRWLYRQYELLNPHLIVSSKGSETVVLQPSGRFAANRTTFNSFTLVIHEVQTTDSGLYGCVSNDVYRIIRLCVHCKYLLHFQNRFHHHLFKQNEQKQSKSI